MSDASERLARIDESAATVAENNPPPQPEFDLSVGWAAGYDGLFGGKLERSTPIEELVEVALRRGRVLLHAEGGTGKSAIVLRLLRHALAHGHLAVLLDVRRWTPPLFDEWGEAADNELYRMNLLFEHLGAQAVSEAELSLAPPSRKRVVLVDGINEVPSAVGGSILTALEAFAWRNPAAGVIATDRLARRELPSDAWQLATIEPISTATASQVLQADVPEEAAPLLRTAFFLDLAVKQGLDSTSSSRAFRHYFEQHVGLGPAQIVAAGAAAFDAYATERRRRFPFAPFRAVAGDRTTEALIESGTLILDGDEAYFIHHLYHDYLASAHLAADPEKWTSEHFDALTFKASSFDALAMALEQLDDPTRADDLLRRVYDWNFYGSAYALAKGRTLGASDVSKQMETALLTMLAERRWDVLRSTSERVTDALQIFPGETASALLDVRDLDELIAFVNQLPIEGEAFYRWRTLFSTPPGSDGDTDTIALLEGEDSLLGWTAANVLKRVRLNDEQQEYVRRLLAEAPETVRWRASHVLGAHPSAANVEALAAALHDGYHWVRYGSIRSLVEIAARDPELRSSAFERVRASLDALADDSSTIQEFERALILREPPPDWADAVEPVIEQMWAAAETIELQDHWRRVAYDVQKAASG